MSQTKKLSAIESSVNVIVGFLVAFLSQLLVFPIFDIYVTMYDHLGISLWFTAISFFRSYLIRRAFNR